MKRTGLFLMVAFMVIAAISCDKKDETIYEDGTYSAEEAEFGHGWKGFLNVEIADDKIVSADFDYFNAEEALKSETTEETYPMPYHPTIWIPLFESELMALDLTASSVDVDAKTGATSSSTGLNALLDAILVAAKAGDTTKQIVP